MLPSRYICALPKTIYMFRYLIVVLLFVGFSADVDAQRHSDPRSYYREFQSQSRRIQMKNMRYLEAVVKGDDARRVAKMREMVLEQLKESRRDLERVGPYKDDEVLHREYMKGLEMFINAMEKNFEKADVLVVSANESFEDRMKYFEAQEEAEAQMIDAIYKIEEAENYFAKTYDVDLRRDPEDKRKFDKLDLLTVYMRDLSIPFYRVDARIQSLISAAEARKGDTLFDILSDLRTAVAESKNDIEDIPQFDGKDWLEKEVRDYLEELTDEMDETIQPLVDQLSNNFLPEDEFEDAQEDFARFKEWQADRVADFKQTKSDVVIRYLEE